jgi:hypothetical protein
MEEKAEKWYINFLINITKATLVKDKKLAKEFLEELKWISETVPPKYREDRKLNNFLQKTLKHYKAISEGQRKYLYLPPDYKEDLIEKLNMDEEEFRLAYTLEFNDKCVSRRIKREGREPTPEEMAQKIEFPLDKVRKILGIAKEPISLETPIGEEEDRNLHDQTKKVLSSLIPHEEKVLRRRFGIGEKADHTLEEVGQDFDVTRERVRQIEGKALRKLRHPSRSKKLRTFIER